MGKVFSWMDIEEGRVPALPSFNDVISSIRATILAEEAFLGGIFCGNAVRGQFTPRSDVDCVVVYDPAQRDRAFEALRVLHADAAERFVALDLVPLDAEIARTGLHAIGPNFFAALRSASAQGGEVGEGTMARISAPAISVADDTREYLRYKLWELETGINALPGMRGDAYYRFLQKVLDVALNAARNILRWRNADLRDDAREHVLRLYLRIADDREKELFSSLIGADVGYTSMLRAQIVRPDEERYARVIAGVHARAVDAHEFVRRNLLRFS